MGEWRLLLESVSRSKECRHTQAMYGWQALYRLQIFIQKREMNTLNVALETQRVLFCIVWQHMSLRKMQNVKIVAMET
jgi:hypothetical protein